MLKYSKRQYSCHTVEENIKINGTRLIISQFHVIIPKGNYKRNEQMPTLIQYFGLK